MSLFGIYLVEEDGPGQLMFSPFYRGQVDERGLVSEARASVRQPCSFRCLAGGGEPQQHRLENVPNRRARGIAPFPQQSPDLTPGQAGRVDGRTGLRRPETPTHPLSRAGRSPGWGNSRLEPGPTPGTHHRAGEEGKGQLQKPC